MFKFIVSFIIVVVYFTAEIHCQSAVNWVFLNQGQTNGTNCTSSTDTLQGKSCYGLEYTPTVSGKVTSYTFGFQIDCVDMVLPSVETSSCHMTNNTNTIDGCSIANIFLLQASGNNGSKTITANVPVILHQVCMVLPAGSSVGVIEDEITGMTVSIDSAGTNNPITDSPGFSGYTAESIAIIPCADTTLCSVNFGTLANRFTFEQNVNGYLSDGSSIATSFPTTQSFNIYDEVNENCSAPGGIADLSMTFESINTVDQYGNGIIDTLAGLGHRIQQGTHGLNGRIPLGSNANSESSSGDTRGYSITVNFASHIGIIADRFSVKLAGLNSASGAFESARLVFFGNNNVAYGTANYLGLYGSEADLTGQCLTTNPLANPWNANGNGVLVFQNTNTVNLVDPCNPVAGSATPDTLSINARFDAGLDSAAVIRGFSLVVIGEDVAAPNMLDDGSNANGEDNIKANRNTTTNEVLLSSLLGYTVEGCIFDGIALAVDYLSLDVKQKDNSAFLTWSTSREVNNDFFEVEWSSDGKFFEKLGKVYPDNPGRIYSYEHKTPLKGFNYYRLKQVDLDGKYEYSDIKKLYFNGTSIQSYLLFPNPVENALIINSSMIEKFPVKIEVFSMDGKLIEALSLNPQVGKFILNTSNYKSGQYIIKLNNSVHKFVKI